MADTALSAGTAGTAAVQDVRGTHCYIVTPRNRHEQQLLLLERLEQALQETHNQEERARLEKAIQGLREKIESWRRR
jgi:hypothetical protein